MRWRATSCRRRRASPASKAPRPCTERVQCNRHPSTPVTTAMAMSSTPTERATEGAHDHVAATAGDDAGDRGEARAAAADERAREDVGHVDAGQYDHAEHDQEEEPEIRCVSYGWSSDSTD